MQFNFIQTAGSSFSFNNVFTSINPFAPAGTGYSFASFLLGTGTTGSMAMNTRTAGQEQYQALFVADTFQVNRKLTLNYGLRWELMGPWTERYDRAHRPATGCSEPAGSADRIATQGQTGAREFRAIARSAATWMYRGNCFHLRFGFAYRLTDKYVIQGRVWHILFADRCLVRAGPARRTRQRHDHSLGAHDRRGHYTVGHSEQSVSERLHQTAGT